MKAEYDFSKGERGKFYNKETIFQTPIYLEEDVCVFLQHLAKKRKRSRRTC